MKYKAHYDNREIEINIKDDANMTELLSISEAALGWFLSLSAQNTYPIEMKDLLWFASLLKGLSDFDVDDKSLDDLVPIYNEIKRNLKRDLGCAYNDVYNAYSLRIDQLFESSGRGDSTAAIVEIVKGLIDTLTGKNADTNIESTETATESIEE